MVLPKRVLCDDDLDDDTCKSILRSLVTSTREKLTVPELAIQYVRTRGAYFPFSRCGNKSLLDYLASNPDVAKLVVNSGDEDNPLVEPVISEGLEHMRHLVETQLDNVKTDSPENAIEFRRRFQTEECEAIVSRNCLTNRYINSIRETDESKIGLPVWKKPSPIPDSLVLTIFQTLKKYGQDGLHRDNLLFELSHIGHEVENVYFFHTLKRCGNFFDVNDELFVSNKVDELPNNISECLIDTKEGLQDSDSDDDDSDITGDNEKKTAYAKNLTLDTLELEKFNNMITFSRNLPTDVGKETGVESSGRRFQIGDILRLHITAFHDVNSFFFRLCSDNENFQRMRSSLHKVCNENVNNPDFKVDPNKVYQRLDCVAKFDDHWERAIVCSIVDPTTVKVFLIDSGSVEIINVSKLLHLKPFFQTLPVQVFEGRLANVQPLYMATDEDKLQERLNAFMEMTENIHLCAIVGKLNNNDAVIRPLIYNLELIDTNNKYDVNIGEELLKRGLVARETDCPMYSTNEILLHSFHTWVDTYLYQLTFDSLNCEPLRGPRIDSGNHVANKYGNNGKYNFDTSSNRNTNFRNFGPHNIRSKSSSKISDGNKRLNENNGDRKFEEDREKDFLVNQKRSRSVHQSAYEKEEKRSGASFTNTQNNNRFVRESRRDVFDHGYNSRKSGDRNYGRGDRKNEFSKRSGMSYRINGNNGNCVNKFGDGNKETYRTNGDINYGTGNGKNKFGEGSRRLCRINGESFGNDGSENKSGDKNKEMRPTNGDKNFRGNDRKNKFSDRTRFYSSNGEKFSGNDGKNQYVNEETNKINGHRNKSSIGFRSGEGSERSYGKNFGRNFQRTNISCKFGDQNRKASNDAVSPECNLKEGSRRSCDKSQGERNFNRSDTENNSGGPNREMYKISAKKSDEVPVPSTINGFKEGSRSSYASNGDSISNRSDSENKFGDRNKKTYKISAEKENGLPHTDGDSEEGSKRSYEKIDEITRGRNQGNQYSDKIINPCDINGERNSGARFPDNRFGEGSRKSDGTNDKNNFGGSNREYRNINNERNNRVRSQKKNYRNRSKK